MSPRRMLVCGVSLIAALAMGACVHRVFSADSLVARGRHLFNAHGCNGCHTVGVVGTPLGPDLTDIGQRYSRTRLERWLRDPASQDPTAHMPLLDLPERDVEALAAYLAALR